MGIRKSKTYEWFVEAVDADGDIIDIEHADTLKEVLGYRGRYEEAAAEDIGVKIWTVYKENGVVVDTDGFEQVYWKFGAFCMYDFSKEAFVEINNAVPKRFYKQIEGVKL